MSWLADRKIQYLYRDLTGEELIFEYEAAVDAPSSTKFEGRVYQKIEMLPYKTNLTFKVQFERNGLIAYKYDTGNGKPRIVSATRENYEKNVGNMPEHKIRQLKKEGRLSEINKSITTKGYQRAFEKVKEKRGGK